MATEDDPLDPTGADERPRYVTDLFRKLVVTSMGAVFMTEEGIRSLVKEVKLPKELIGAVLAQADRTKAEVLRIAAAEVRGFLESAQVREQILAMLEQVTIELKAEVKVKPREASGRLFAPDVKTRVERKPRRKRAPAKKKR